MSRAEKFIQDCTRNCSNEIGYCHNKTCNHNHIFYDWLTPDQARRAVEIEREEMIKKVCNFITDKLFFKDNMLYTNIKSKIIEDIKQTMKDE